MQEPINNQSMLKVGTILRGTYRIDSYLSSGGFGNTYVATNIEFEERVAIKEFFMKGVTHRDDNQTTISVSNAENRNSFLEQKEKFKKEARRIRQLRNEHIVNVHDLFEENGTAYYVMDYVDGENLAERLQKTGRPMAESEVRLILPQILNALKAVHDAGIWHLDLKPANIMLEKGGVIKLIDFGASKQLNSQKGGATTSTAITYTNGYAPREQMEQNYDKFGPWTDIYALGATLYNLLTNKRPPLPTDIDDDLTSDKHEALPFPGGVSPETKSMVLMMLNTNRLQRPRSVDGIILSSPFHKELKEPFLQQTDSLFTNEETIIVNSHRDQQGQMNNGNLSIPPHSIEQPINAQCEGMKLIDKTSKVLIDNLNKPYSKEWISFFAIGIVCCDIIIVAPVVYYDYRGDSNTFETTSFFNLYMICYLLFPIFTSTLYAKLSKGVRKMNKVISLLSALCSVLIIAKLLDAIFLANASIEWSLFYCTNLLGLSSGIYMLSHCMGNIVRLGKIFVTYYCINSFLNLFSLFGISSEFERATYAIYEISVWGIDVLWVYGMWWMLTRRPTKETN